MAQQVPDPSPVCLKSFMEDDHINLRGKRIRDDQQDEVTKSVSLEQHDTLRDIHFFRPASFDEPQQWYYLHRSISDSALSEQKRWMQYSYIFNAGSEQYRRVRSLRYPPASENAVIPSETKTEINLSQCNGDESHVAIQIGLEKEVESDRKMILPIIRCSHTNLNQHTHKNKNKKTKQIKPMVVCEENDEEVESYSKKVPCLVMLLMICVWGWLLTRRRERITIGGSVVELLSFMVFASGAALTILFGERFSHTHGAIFISWAVLMHVGIDHSISLLFLAILALFFGASHALTSFITHNNNQIQQHILTSSKIVKPGGSLDLHTMLCI